MGYCMYQTESVFSIKKENFEKALQAIKDIAKDGNEQWGWTEKKDFINANTIFKAMEGWRWEVWSIKEDENIDQITFTGEKLGEDIVLFIAIAPFVEKDSYIQMQGEDDTMWRWVFDGKTCKEIYPDIRW